MRLVLDGFRHWSQRQPVAVVGRRKIEGLRPAPQRPWEGAEGLEWEVPSPAPFHTFETPPRLDKTATRVIG